jgi:hypothetical protein
MFDVPGPISARLLIEHGPESPGWWPPRAHPPARPVECGWPVCGRISSPAGPQIDARQHADRPGPTTVAATAA